VKNRSYESVIIAYIIVLSNARITHSFRMHFGGQNATKTHLRASVTSKIFPGVIPPDPIKRGGERLGRGGRKRGSEEKQKGGEVVGRGREG
jgi:hypothetical protein